MGFSAVFLVFATGTWDLNCEVWGERDVAAKYARNPALQGHIRPVSAQSSFFEIMKVALTPPTQDGHIRTDHAAGISSVGETEVCGRVRG
jgi:hypothetical protein